MASSAGKRQGGVRNPRDVRILFYVGLAMVFLKRTASVEKELIDRATDTSLGKGS